MGNNRGSMRVLIATGLYAPEIGGPATHVEILEREFPRLNIEVVASPFAPVRAYPKLFRHIAYCWSLLKRMKGVTLVYALDPVSVGLPALIATRLSGKPFVLRVAGDYAWEQAVGRYASPLFLDEFLARISLQPFTIRMLARIERYVARNAVIIIVPSEYLKRVVLAWGVHEDRIRVVYNSYEPIEIEKEKESIRKDLGYRGTVLVSAGRLVPWKGFRTLIDIVASLRAEGRNVMSVIAGDGPDRDALVAYVKEKDVAGHVFFLGRKSREELAEVIRGADIFVLNTGYEGFSHQILEVMALGVPVVTTPAGGNTELIEDDVTGLLAGHDDAPALRKAILRLVDDHVLYDRLVHAAQNRALSFSIARMVEGVRAVLTEAST